MSWYGVIYYGIQVRVCFGEYNVTKEHLVLGGGYRVQRWNVSTRGNIKFLNILNV